MKRVLLSLLMLIMFTPSAFGNATDDLLKIVEDKNATPEQVITLIKKGADVNAMKKGTGRESGIDWPVLQVAVMWNEKIKVLLKAGVYVDAKSTFFGDTALMLANNPEVTKLLLNAGAYVDAKNYFGDTALMWAVQYNTNPEVIKLLLNAGVALNIKNQDGKDAITLAQENSNPEIHNMFKVLEFGGKKTALINAAQKNASPSDFRSLIEAGADIHATNQNGATALMIAAANTSYPDVIKILTEAGIDVNAKSNDGQTALMYAARFNPKPKILRAILNAGADINAKDSLFFGKTAKDYAAESGASQEVIKILEGL